MARHHESVNVTVDFCVLPLLEERLLSLWRQGGCQPLAAWTDFGWDAVALFHEGASARELSLALGQPVLAPGEFFDRARNLLAFRHGEVLGPLVLIGPELFAAASFGRWFAAPVAIDSAHAGERLSLVSGAPGPA